MTVVGAAIRLHVLLTIHPKGSLKGSNLSFRKVRSWGKRVRFSAARCPWYPQGVSDWWLGMAWDGLALQVGRVAWTEADAASDNIDGVEAVRTQYCHYAAFGFGVVDDDGGQQVCMTLKLGNTAADWSAMPRLVSPAHDH